MTKLLGTLAAEDRRDWLSEQLQRIGSVALSEAAAALGVSEMTIRRDLAELEERGRARRVRGGAKAVGPQTFSERRATMTRAKAAIAAKLAALVPSTGTVAFDASSTVMRLATGLHDARDLVVVTNGSETFAALQEQPGVTALLTGGRLDPRTGSLVGPLARWAATQFAFECFVASAAAVDPMAGALEVTVEEADVKRALASAAERVVLGADSSKLDTRAASVGLCWDGIDLLVTELDPDDERLVPYRDAVEIL